MTDIYMLQDGIHEMNRVAKQFTMSVLIQQKLIVFRFLLVVNGYWQLDLQIRQVMMMMICTWMIMLTVTFRLWHCGI